MAELARRMREINMIFEAENVTDVTTHPLFEEYESIVMLMSEMCMSL